ncbi:MAG TPA: serine hydrolase domain-containing protein, partial [Blastocatellia bacterium]|nr:serine hydrolase domain-containing protein [Blastocatellia bacterium]
MKTRLPLLLTAVFAVSPLGTGMPAAQDIRPDAAASDARVFAHLEQRLDSIRQQLKIPGMSCAIVKDQKVVWAKGFGYADVENKIPATEHTSYHLASLTKTFASTILMQLVQEGKVKLDDPVSK